MRMLASEAPDHVGDAPIEVKGWVQSRRDHGGLIFIDLRDHTGVVQLVIQPETKDAFDVAEQLRDEFVIAATGVVRERDENLKNPNIATGAIEIKVAELTILNRSEPLPVQIHGDNLANEELRLKYRFLDLRRPKMQTMLQRRSDYYKLMRDYMGEHGFVEVSTPVLANSSPEGARDFLIPSRVHAGKFYALPQAPQQFKQLLMVGGIPRYYQIATCFRDEDPRADRLYGEFYQLDMEMSFVEDGEEVRQTMDPLVKQLVTDFAGKTLLSEDIPRIPYQEVMERYGSDKPDLRYGMELIEVTHELRDTEFSVFKNAACVKAICVKNASSLSRSQIDQFTEIAKSEGAGGLAYLTFEDGEIKSPIVKFLKPEELDAIRHKTGAEDGDIVFFGADERRVVNGVLGRLRKEFAEHFKLADPNVVAALWVVDFPFYEWDEKTNKLDFGHNPFSMPKGGLEALNAEDKLNILADQYDIVLNGYECCSGGVRNHSPEIMYKAFGNLGYDQEYVDTRFGAMVNAFQYGAPPHAGCAFGIDRMFMVLMGEDNIREIVAFPKNGSGMDVMTGSPSTVDEQQLKELHIQTTTDD
ncbi:MAG TPA: aspartate--tRNA ligase [Candidatus Saccharimonadales bacterium]|nr:aspartate--tRNA ligase [Candidatus Saccharimonadales bacterium]